VTTRSYRKQAEQDLLFTIRDLAHRERLSRKDGLKLENDARVFLEAHKFKSLSWDDIEYFEIAELFQPKLIKQDVKVRAILSHMQDPMLSQHEPDTMFTYLTFEDPDHGDTIKTHAVTSTSLIQRIKQERRQYHIFDILATPYPYASSRGDEFRLLVHDMRISHHCLQIIQVKPDEIRDIEKLVLNLKNKGGNIFSYIKNIVVKNVGIEGLNKSPILESSIEAIIVQAFSDGFVINTNASGKIHTLVIGAPAVGKKLLTNVARILNPVFQEAHPSKATVAGVCSTAEHRDSGWISRPGYIPLAHRGVFTIQDFHSVKDSQKDRLLGIFSMVMEDGKAIDSTASRSVHPALTSIHLDMNKRTDLFPESKLRGDSIISKRLDDIKIPMSTLSRFDFVVDIQRDTQRQIEMALKMYQHGAMATVEEPLPTQKAWERQLQVLVAHLRDKHPEVHFSQKVVKAMEAKQREIVDQNKEHLEHLPFFGDFQSRLTNSVYKFVAAFARLNDRDQASPGDVEVAFQLIARKFEFLQTLEAQLKVPRSWEAPEREDLDDWLRQRFSGLTVATSDITKEYEKEFTTQLLPRTLQRHLKDLLSQGIVRKLKKGVYRF